MPQFKLDRYDVLVQTDDGGQAVHTVTVYHADELFAEREAPKYGLTIKLDDEGKPDVGSILGQHLQTLQVWAVLKREGKYGKPFANFMKTDCLALQAAEDLVLDPTSEGTAAPSSSATTSHPSLSGSTQPAPVATTG